MKRLALSMLFFLQGCSVNYIGQPVTQLTRFNSQICIIESPNVRAEFLIAYTKLLKAKGFKPKVIRENSDINSCELTSTYMGKWSWDFTAYMATAEIKIYQEDVLIGQATYAAPRAGFSFTTEIYDSTEEKISGMLAKLFP
jgi:hypothetical protein